MSRAAGVVALVACIAVALAPGVPAASSPSTPTPAPAPAAVNCQVSDWSCDPCAAKCCTESCTQTCTRSKTVEASNGGICSYSLSKTQACPACASPPPNPPPAAYDGPRVVTVDAAVELSAATAASAVKKEVASKAGVPEDKVTVTSSDESAGAVFKVEFVDVGTAGVNDAAARALAFITKLRIDANATLNFASAVKSVAVAVDAALLNCDGGKTWKDAQTLVDQKAFKPAAEELVLLALCGSVKAKSETDAAFDANEYNLLGYSYRKMSPPDYTRSEMFYRRALQVDPKHVDALSYLAELYVDVNRPKEANEVLTDLKAQCPAPKGCYALWFALNVFAAAKVTQDTYIVPVAWDACFEEKCGSAAKPLEIFEGDALMFKYSASHDVVEQTTAAAHAACEGLDVAANLVGAKEAGAAGAKVPFPAAGTRYFACGTNGHCDQGQKIVVKVHPAPDVDKMIKETAPKAEETAATPPAVVTPPAGDTMVDSAAGSVPGAGSYALLFVVAACFAALEILCSGSI